MDPLATVNGQQTTEPAKTTDTPPVKLAGKFESQAALETGIRNGMKRLADAGLAGVMRDIPAEGDLVGEGKTFADAAAAEAFYKGVESAMGRLPKPKEAAPASITAPADDKPQDQPAAVKMSELTDDQIVEKLGKDKFDAAVEQFIKTGELTAEQYAEAEKIGISKTEAKLRLENAAFKAEQLNNKKRAAEAAAATALGADQLAATREFAKTMPQADRDKYQGMVDADPDCFPQVMELLNTKRLSGMGADKAGNIIGGGQQRSQAPSRVDAATVAQLHNKAGQGDKTARQQLDALTQEQLDAAAKSLV